MKKYLFISNSTKPTEEEEMSREKIVLSNVSLPCIEAALNMNYKVYMGVNRVDAEELDCDYEVEFYNSSTYRSLTDLKSNYKAFKNLMALLRKEKIEVIHCNTPIGGLIGRICGKLANVNKIIYTAHGFHFYEGAPLFNRTIIKWAEKWMARYTDAIITMNEEDYRAAQKFNLRNGGNVYKVPGVGVDTEIYQMVGVDKIEMRKSLGIKESDIVLIAMGDLVARKNYSSSIRAIARTNNSRLHFLICGMGPELDSLKKLSYDLGIENQIHFLGYRGDVKELLKISDIFLFTSYQEGLPRSMMEAMASGLPCVCSKIRGNVDLIEDGKGGYLNDPDDIVGIAKAINDLATDKDLRERMSKINLNKIKQFDIENVKLVIKSIYSKELF